ncbi:LysR family transcriptional regulator [Peptoniphilus catoniae]|uniref:LysR family transcriptional regulator n=1 Tax=Peptoniphilus catoniae TaxID=1660341 RepID=UPI0010FD0BF0|nr:LysR family transcriptional regulator [Peptoniphilus catoniae]
MEKSLFYFIEASKEMNFTKTAKRCFITQQGLSDHIKRLEETYDTCLFERKPKLKLTRQGELLLDYAKKVLVMEKDLNKKIEEYNKKTRGEFSFGINASRARILLPETLSNYMEIYPNIKVSSVLDDTVKHSERIINGELDMFLGVNTPANKLLNIKKVFFDNIFVVLSKNTLEKTFGNSADTYLKNPLKKINLRDLSKLKFILSLGQSTTTSRVNEFFNEKSINLNSTIFISDYDTQFDICSKEFAATFSPTLILSRVIERNKCCLSEKEKLLAFRIYGLEDSLSIEFVKHKYFNPPEYINKFIEILEYEIKQTYMDIENYFSIEKNKPSH